ncbi:EndoU domain-containing protein [Vibrio europaeus]|uniref:EndoU domain-containing protein n=1 Tax=Vibrio europaeus TaxID=300876 RepID=UPI0039E14409
MNKIIKLGGLLFYGLSFSLLAGGSTPFFDDDPSTKFAPEYTFEANSIDEDVLKMCGEFGKQVSRKELKTLFETHPNLTKSLLSINQSLDLEKLIDIWYTKRGFTHIFCGEIKKKNGRYSLGGLHYAPRYQQLFEMKKISMCQPGMTACTTKDNEVVEDQGIYSIPVSFKTPDGREFKAVNGYNIKMNADEILYEATRGFFKLNGEIGCFLDIPETGGYPAHTSVIVSTNGKGITTFYSVGPIGRANNEQQHENKDCK